jgi:exoribonuclease R
MNIFEENYTKYIEPIYYKLSSPIEFTDFSINTHSYTIQNRYDMTSLKTYSIDPPGCKDADDAFSIYYDNNKLFLVIHIADPTEFIDISSNLWNNICDRVTTKYLSNRPSVPMLPNKILELSSLMTNEQEEIKYAISIKCEIDTDTYLPIRKINLYFSKITVSSQNSYTYNQASLSSNNDFAIGLKISQALKNKRLINTKGTKLSEINIAYPVYQDNNIFLYEDTFNEKKMKQMIGEFAIFSNTFIGEYLKIHINCGIFRTCDATDWLNTIHNNISGEDMLKEIIKNGIKADYLSNIKSHDLVGSPEYSHFTSPIRRLSDCICHYLLKYIYLKLPIQPFDSKQLEILAILCDSVSKKDRKNGFLDIKFRLLQIMANMVYNNGFITIGFYITGYSGLFLNIIINKINNYNINMSYTIRTRNYNKPIDEDFIEYIVITKINCFIKYDQGTIPELDEYILN